VPHLAPNPSDAAGFGEYFFPVAVMTLAGTVQQVLNLTVAAAAAAA